MDLTFGKFKDIGDGRIRKKLLLVDYSPHWLNTGRRSSRPARRSYKLTHPA